MTDSATGPDQFTGATPDNAIRNAERINDGPMLAADGTPLKQSLARSLRRQKLRALLLIAPLLLFVLLTFVAPILDMLFRSVENQIVGSTLPRTVAALEQWDGADDELPPDDIYARLTHDFIEAAERREHMALAGRLNYEVPGFSQPFRATGRDIDDVGEWALDQFVALDPAWEEPTTWTALMADPAWQAALEQWQADYAAWREELVALSEVRNAATEELDTLQAEIVDIGVAAVRQADPELRAEYTDAEGTLDVDAVRAAVIDGSADIPLSAAQDAEIGRIEDALTAIRDDVADARAAFSAHNDMEPAMPAFILNDTAANALPETANAYAGFADVVQQVDEELPTEEEPWAPIYGALYRDLAEPAPALDGYDGPQAELLAEARAAVADFEAVSPREEMIAAAELWGEPRTWAVLRSFSSDFTTGYFLRAADLRLTPDGVEAQPENQRIMIPLFIRTLFMSLVITGSCILLGYPIAYLLSNLPSRVSNMLLILVLLPFWTSLLVRTSAWKVLLQNQGVINDLLVWMGLVADDGRLALINNQTGTIIAMTHILLPFMILPLYSVMKTIPPSYMRAAKSLGATNFVAFWRVYFPNSVPGIGAGSILVFILSIGYYITPELVGGESGTFISNRIAYAISDSLDWGLAAALGTVLLAVVLVLYWCYDRLVGIDNVKLGG